MYWFDRGCRVSRPPYESGERFAKFVYVYEFGWISSVMWFSVSPMRAEVYHNEVSTRYKQLMVSPHACVESICRHESTFGCQCSAPCVYGYELNSPTSAELGLVSPTRTGNKPYSRCPIYGQRNNPKSRVDSLFVFQQSLQRCNI